MSDTEKGKRSREAYRQGAEDSKSASGWGHFFHETDDALGKILPIPDFRNSSQKGEHKAYEAGWHDYEDKKYRYKKRSKNRHRSSASSAGDSSSSDSHGIVALIILVALVGGGLWLASIPMNRHTTDQEVWTLRRVKAVNLNIRSAPGIASAIVATLPRGSRLAVTGEPVSKDNGIWLRVSTDDGKIQGWANRDYIDFGPYAERPQPESSVRQERTARSDSGFKQSSTTSSSSSELLEVIPYKQTEHAQPSRQPSPTSNQTPSVTLSPNVRILSDAPGRPKQLPSTSAQPESSDGGAQLKRRPELSSTPGDPESSNGIPRLKRRPE